MSIDFKNIQRSLREYKAKAQTTPNRLCPAVMNEYGIRAIRVDRDPYEMSSSLQLKPTILLKMDLARCLQEVAPGFNEVANLRAAFLKIDALEPHPQDMLWREDQLLLLTASLGIKPERSLLDVAERERLVSSHRDATPGKIMDRIKDGMTEAEKISGFDQAREIMTIMNKKRDEMARTLLHARQMTGYRIGQACMRIGSGGPHTILHRVALNTKIGNAYVRALDVLWVDTIWVNPTEVYVPGAKGDDYMEHIWMGLYDTGLFSLFAFQDSGAVAHYWNVRQGNANRGGLEIPQEYLDPNMNIIKPLDSAAGSFGLKQEFNLALRFLGMTEDEVPLPPSYSKSSVLRKTPAFELVMLNALEMPEAPFPLDQIAYR